MIKTIGLWLVGCALCVTPVAADEDVYDGPTAIRPLTVTPQPQHSARPTVCDFEHQCYPAKGGPRVQAPVAPPVVAAAPATFQPEVPDEPIVATWRDCVGRALQNYEQSRDVHALQAATGSCQDRSWRNKVARTMPGQNLRPRWRHPRLTADGTSAAAGGPSAAMPTATVLRGVASDDRKRDAAQLRTPGPLSATSAQRRLRRPLS